MMMVMVMIEYGIISVGGSGVFIELMTVDFNHFEFVVSRVSIASLEKS